jgi:trimeric autotransporter adhesin
MKISTIHHPIILIVLLSGHLSMAQTGNYFSGSFAGANNTTGDYNAFAGYGAGINNVSGSLNTTFGFYAGASNQATSYNTSVGAYAGYFTSSGLGENVFVGYRSGFYNSNGFSNVFLGANAGYVNNSGSYNVFVGSSAGYDNTSGPSNTFIGYASGTNNTSAGGNTFVGNMSGFANTTGNQNTFLGSEAGATATTAANNTFTGFKSGRAVTTGGGNTLVGGFAGLKTTTGSYNMFGGLSAGENNTTGRENTFLGRAAGVTNTTGNGNTALGYFAGPATANLVNASAIGHRAHVRVSNAIVLGSVKGVNGATNTIRVGIGTNSPAYLLHVNGVAAKPGGGSWTVASDRRLKQQIEPYNEGLSYIMQINPIWFRYNGKAGLPTDRRYVGVVAQDMQKIAPHTVGEFTYADSAGRQEKYLDYDANAVVYMLVNAVKELNTQSQQKDAQILQLQQELAEIRKMLGSLDRSGDVGAYLGQNFPNPFTRSTIIPYFLPENSGSAQLKIYSLAGQEVYSAELLQRGDAEIEIPSQVLSAGNYVYQLVVDGTSVDSKKMLLSK